MADQSTEQSQNIAERVSKQSISENVGSAEAQDAQVPETFNINDIDKIEDEQSREIVKQAYKSMDKGYQAKFRELSDLRKQIESNQNQPESWTPDRIQGLMNDQNFVNAANQVIQTSSAGNPTNSGMSDQEYSALSNEEQAEMQRLSQLTNQQSQKIDSLLVQQENETLSRKYADYDANKINQFRSDLLNGKIQPTGEHLYKVLNYEDGMKKAYELGKQDAGYTLNEKVNSFTMEGVSGNVPHRELPKLEKNESTQSAFKKIALANLARLRKQKIERT